MDGENQISTPRGLPVIDQLGDAVNNLQDATSNAIAHIVERKEKLGSTLYDLIWAHKQHATSLLRIANRIYSEGSKEKEIVDLMKHKMLRSLYECDYYIGISEISDYEETISRLERDIHQYDPVSSLFIEKFVYWSQTFFAKRQLLREIATLINKLDFILTDDHSKELYPSEREYLELQWKHYAQKAQSLGIQIAPVS